MKYPKVSIVIPTYNEEKHITECLDSIMNQYYTNYEIIVVDGMSTDNTKNIVGKYNVILLDNPKKIMPCGTNIGIKHSKGEYIVLLGGHSFIPENFLSKNLEIFKELKKNFPELVCVGGEHKIKYENKFSKLANIVLHSRFSGGRSLYKRKAGFVDTIIYGFYDARVLKTNLFDESFAIGNDNELNFRLFNKSYKFYYSPEIQSYYYSRSSLTKFIKQLYNYGIAKARLIKKDKRNFRFSFLVPSFFVLYLISLFFYNILFYSIPLIIFLSLNLIFSLKEAKNYNELRNLPILFVLFFLLYITLGIGFLYGVSK